MKKFDNFFNGYELEAYKLFGSHKKDGGVEFSVWAPHAKKVEVFMSTDWSNYIPMEKIDERGVWSTFVDGIEPIHMYKYRIWKNDYQFVEKSDPYAYCFEKRPANSSCMYDLSYFTFSDQKFLKERNVGYDRPMNIYELHLNGFTRDEEGAEFCTYQEMKRNLIPYLKEMGYNYVEFMPVFEHPFDGSWGYQATGFFGATSRYGTPYDLMDLVNELHLNGISTLLDVVFVHFAPDEFALVNFDGQPCYEYKESHLAKSDWGSYCFDLTNPCVVSFLMSSANFFLKEYHFDGLRFDAVSHLIYHKGNRNLGENVAGIDFVKRITHHLKTIHPQCVLIAEDSTDAPNVTKPAMYGGLGFDYKWDLGWMNDTLTYYKMDPIYKSHHHNTITFSMAYFYSERFLLPFSHDEVVHSKATIIQKMWGMYENKFPLCRNLFLYMYNHPGKKLNFEGNEIAMFREFDERKPLDWFMLEYPLHDSFQRFIRDLNKTYLSSSVFWGHDYDYRYFKWIDADNREQSIFSFFRFNDEGEVIVTVLNMLPTSYENYRIGVPFKGTYTEIINSEKDIYSGCNMCNFEPIESEDIEAHKLAQSINIRIAPFAGIMFRTKVTPTTIKKFLNPDYKPEKKPRAKKETVKKAPKKVVKEKVVKKETKTKKAAAKKTVKKETVKKTVKKTGTKKATKK